MNMRGLEVSQEVASTTTAQLETSLRESVSADRLRRHLDRFSSLIRHSGSDDERRAANYIVEALHAWKIAVELLEVEALISTPLPSRLLILNDGQRPVIEFPARARSFGAPTSHNGLEAELVYVPVATPPRGEMIFSHRVAAGEYDGLEVAGKVVITADGGPDGVLRAQERGAIGHVHIWPSDEDVVHEMIASGVWGTPTVESTHRLPSIPVLGLNHRDGGQIVRLLQSGPVRARIESAVATGWVRLPLVTATIPGAASEDYLLIGAHIDSWYEGVTDNATGDVALLEMAKVLADHAAELHYGVRLAWWPGHSTGRYAGSTWFADTHFRELRDHGLGYLNIDSPGVRDAQVWDCRYNTGEVEHVTASVVRELSGQEPRIRRPLRAADQSFLGIGLPSLGAYRMLPASHPDRKTVGGCGGAYWWHSPEDTRDKADVAVLAADTEIYLALVARLCASERLPYNFVPTAQDFIDHLAVLQNTAGDHLDLTPTIHEAEAFRGAATRLATASGSDLSSQNQGLKRIARVLNPALFTVRGPFEMDPALQMPLLPGLAPVTKLAAMDPASSEYRFLLTSLRRQQNRIEDALIVATEMAETCVG